MAAELETHSGWYPERSGRDLKHRNYSLRTFQELRIMHFEDKWTLYWSSIAQSESVRSQNMEACTSMLDIQDVTRLCREASSCGKLAVVYGEQTLRSRETLT